MPGKEYTPSSVGYLGSSERQCGKLILSYLVYPLFWLPCIYLAVYGHLKATKAVFFGSELQSIKYCSVRGSCLCPLIPSQVLFRVGSSAFTDKFDCILCLFLYNYNADCCSAIAPSKSCMSLACGKSNSETFPRAVCPNC